MFFDKATKQVFLFPTKVGTMSARHFLGSIGWHGKMPIHGKPNQLLDKYPNLDNYSFFGFFRDPVSRFESAILHLKQMPSILNSNLDNFLNGTSRENARYELFLSNEFLSLFPVVFDRQVDWLDHPKVTPLDFDNFESELRRVTGNTTQPLERRNANTDFGRQEITDDVRAFVREYYAADYALAKDRLGKEY